MIIEWLVSAVLDVLTAVLALLPDLALPFGTYPEQFGEAIGGAVGGLDGVVPITEAAIVVGWALTTYMPVMVAFYVTRWIYTHLPIIGNGG